MLGKVATWIERIVEEITPSLRAKNEIHYIYHFVAHPPSWSSPPSNTKPITSIKRIYICVYKYTFRLNS